MANTLTGLIPVIYDALDIISRELTGMVTAVGIDANADAVAKDQTLRIPIVPAATAAAITPAQYAPDTGDQTVSYVDMTIDQYYHCPVRFTGMEQKSLGGIYQPILRDSFAQAMRTLVNQLENDLTEVAYKNASRAYGTAGTTPFASDLSAAAQLRKILDDNGAPQGDRALIIDTAAGVNMRSLANLNADYAAGTTQTLRQGTLLPLFGFDVKESAQIQSHTKGTGTGYDIVAAGEAVGQTTLSLEGGNSGTILAGDIVTFAGGTADTNKYCVIDNSTINTASGSASGNIPIGNPGLRIVKVDADEMTIGSNYTANLGFHRQAVQLVARVPEMPYEGDMADDVMNVTDPLTGITFQIAVYKQFRQVHYEVCLAWGVKAIKSEHIAILIG